MAMFGTLIAYLIAILMIGYAAGYRILSNNFTMSANIPRHVSGIGFTGLILLFLLVF